MGSIRRITAVLIISIVLTVSGGTTALGYNPFLPDYRPGGQPAAEPDLGRMLDNADHSFTGKRTGTQLRANMDFTDIRNHWARPYILNMAAQSVVRGYGSSRFSPEAFLSRQEAVALMLRIMGREDQVQRRADAGGTMPAGSGIFDSWAREYIAMAEELGMVGIGEGGDWSANATRQEVAVWFARALGLDPVYGADQQYIYNLHDWQGIGPANLPYIEAVLNENIMRGDDRGYFRPASGIRRSEMAVMLDRAADRFYDRRGLESYSGMVLAKGTSDGVPAFAIQNDDGSISAVTLVQGSDFPVSRNGVLGLGQSLQVGDRVDYICDAEGVLYAAVPDDGAVQTGPAAAKGYIRSVSLDDGRLSITDYDGNVHTYRYSSPGVTINQRPAGLHDLKFGQEVELILTGGLVTAVSSVSHIEQPGYIPPAGRVRYGRVVQAGGEGILLELDSGGRQEIALTPDTIVTKEGSNVYISSIRTGDRVQVYMDTVDSFTASRINIEGMQQLVSDVYRGTVESVRPSGGTLVLKGASAFVNGEWQERERLITFELGPETEIYYGGRRVTPEEIQGSFLDLEGYVAVSSNFSSPRAVKVVLKRGAEQRYGGRIIDISWGTGELELKDRNNISIGDSSIVLSKGRLVDMAVLDEDHTITVVADRYGGRNNAVLVVLEDAVTTGDKIYAGRLNEIRTRQFDINYYSSLQDNEWDRISRRTRDLTFDYDRDTYIIDASGKRADVIDADDFFQGDYADDDTRQSSRDYYAYVIADGDRARAVRVTEGGITGSGTGMENDDLEELRVTTGEIRDVDILHNTITMSSSANWSSFYQEWIPSDADTYVNCAGALIFKDGRPAGAKDLRNGENVYVIRDDNRGIIILVL